MATLHDYRIYYYVIWTNNRSQLLEAGTQKQEGKYPMIKVLQGCILTLSLYSVNTVHILYRTGNMQSAIHLSFALSSSLLPRGLQSTHLLMPCYISPYIVYNVYELYSLCTWVLTLYIIIFETWQFLKPPNSTPRGDRHVLPLSFCLKFNS